MLRLKAALLLVCFVFMANISWGRVFYISNSGNDSHNGTSWATAWRSLNHLNDGTFRSGDSVYFGTGKYRGAIQVPDSTLSYHSTSLSPTLYACSSFVEGIAHIWNSDSLAGWVQYSGNIYYHIYSESGSAGEVCQNDSMFWMDESMPSAPGHAFYDASSDRIYVYCRNMSAGYNPSNYDMEATPINRAAVDILWPDGHVKFYGLEIRFGTNRVINITHDYSGGGTLPDDIKIFHCRLRDAHELSGCSNPACVYVALANNGNFNSSCQGLVIRSCQIGSAITSGHCGAGHGSGFVFYGVHGAVVESCLVEGQYTGYALQFKNQMTADSALNNVVRYNTIKAQNNSFTWGIVAFNHQVNDSIYGNIIYGGSNLSSPNIMDAVGTDGSESGYGGPSRNIYFYNNTIYNCLRGFLMNNEIGVDDHDIHFKYNVVYGSNSSNNVMAGLSSTSMYDNNLDLDRNLYYSSVGNYQFFVQGSYLNLSAWRSHGLDINTTTAVNPGFNNPSIMDFSRPNAGQEMNLTYGGRTWTRYGAIQGTTPPPIPKINQVISKNATQSSVTLIDDLSNGTVPYDSLILHWGTVRANIVNLTARDTRVTNVSDPYTFAKSNLTPNTKYYFRVLAYDSGVNGDTSGIDSVNTTLAPIHITQLITKTVTYNSASLSDDLNGGSVPYDSLVLHWSGTRANVLNLNARDSRIVGANDPCVFVKSSLAPGAKYYFRILAFDSGAIGDTTAIDSLTTDTAPLQRIMQSISKNATDNSATLIDDLNAGTAPYDSLILYWSLSRNEVANLIVRDIRVIAATDPYTFTKTSLTQNSKYYFRVSAFDSGAIGDTTAIDSVTTSSTGLNLLSVSVPDSVSGTYPGYNPVNVNDGIISPRGGTATTWASDQSTANPHWVEMIFNNPKIVSRARIAWALNSGNFTWMCSRQYYIQYWDTATNSYRNAAIVNNSSVDSISVTDFTPVTTNKIRYWQPANMGPANYPSILWVTEMEIYGRDIGDVTPPAITDILSSSIGTNTATISWNTDEPATQLVNYGLTQQYGENPAGDSSMVFAHRVVLTNLRPDTLYHFRVRSRDYAGNESISGDFTFHTNANMQLISVGARNSVCGSYPGYSTAPINDGIISARGGTSTTWASDVSSSTPHWIVLTFNNPITVQRAKIYWGWNYYNFSWMCSRQYIIQYWDNSARTFRNAVTVNNNSSDSITITDFPAISTTQIRYWQPANMGPLNSPALVWLTEFQLYGSNPQQVFIPGDQDADERNLRIQNGDDLESIPKEFALLNAYPNPFNPSTRISYNLPQDCYVNITIFNILGDKIIELVNSHESAGRHSVIWNGCNSSGDPAASGIYFYRIQADNFSDTRKMSLMK